MRRKRLQHAADTLCHMFCGWRLVNSGPQLELLGSGSLHIDALTESCEFEGNTLKRTLPIAGELHAWLTRDLATHGIAITDLREASLVATLQLAYRTARQGRGLMHCDIVCESRVITDEKSYTCTFRGAEAWEATRRTKAVQAVAVEGDVSGGIAP